MKVVGGLAAVTICFSNHRVQLPMTLSSRVNEKLTVTQLGDNSGFATL
jgi:hypothetical protein